MIPIIKMPKSSNVGAVLVELAIVVPVLFTLTFAALDYGQIIYSNLEMARILHEGLRLASSDDRVSAPFNSELGCTPRKRSTCTPNSSSCPDVYKIIFDRIEKLKTKTLDGVISISDIKLDYDVSTPEMYSNSSDEGDEDLHDSSYCSISVTPKPACLRTITGRISYQFIGKSIFFKNRTLKVSARVPYLKIGDGEFNVLCS